MRRHLAAEKWVTVQVVQTTATSLMTSNVMEGLSVSAVLALPAGVRAGALTKAYVQAGLNVLAGARAAVAAGSETGQAFAALDADLNELAKAVGTIVSNPTAVVKLPTADGNAFNLNAEALAAMDQFISAYLDEMVPLLEAYSPRSIRADVRPAALLKLCPPPDDPQLDKQTDLLCRRQAVNEQLPTASEPNQRSAADAEGKGVLAVLGEWVATARAEASVKAGKTAKALQLFIATNMPFLTNYMVLPAPPPPPKGLANVGEGLADNLAKQGVPVTNIARNAQRVNRAYPPPDSNNGLIVLSENERSQVGYGKDKFVSMFKKTAGDTVVPCVQGAYCVSIQDMRAPARQLTEPLSAATVPRKSVTTFNGNYIGKFSSTVRVEIPGLPTQAVSVSEEPFRFTIRDGQVTGFGNGGQVSQEGRFSIANNDPSGITCTWGGGILIKPVSGTATGGGGINCHGVAGPATVSMEGDWTADR